MAKRGIKREQFLSSDRYGVLTFLSPHDFLLESFLFDQRSDPQGNSNGAGCLIVSVGEKAIGIGLSLLVVIFFSLRNLSRLNGPIIWIEYIIRGLLHSSSFTIQVRARGGRDGLRHRPATRLHVVLLRRLFLNICHLIYKLKLQKSRQVQVIVRTWEQRDRRESQSDPSTEESKVLIK